MRLLATAACLLATAAAAQPAVTPPPAPPAPAEAAPVALPSITSQSPTIARIRQAGVLHCGSAIRPGLAFPDADHVWYGIHADFCHAIANVILGDPSKIEFYGYALRPNFDRIRPKTGVAGTVIPPEDDVAFLTGTELFANELFGAVLPGPVVFQQANQIMVWDTSPIHNIADLARTTICVEPGTGADRALAAYAKEHAWDANIMGWMELEEMMDAFNVGRCPAVAGELTALAALRLGSEHEGHPTRILEQPLSATPVMAATPAADPAWSIIVTWTINSILATPPGNKPVTDILPVPGEWLGLDRDWQKRATAIGPYAEMVRHSLGDRSPLHLPPAMTASWQNGGLTLPPTVE